MTGASPAAYPIQLDAAGPAAQNRLTVFFRLILGIPHLVVLMFLGMAAWVIYFISWFIILFTGRYPEGLLRFMIGYLRWTTRVYGYYALLTDKYPPFSLDPEEAYPVRLTVEERVANRNRLTTFWLIRWLLAIPHYIILMVLQYALYVVLFIAWFIVLIVGSLPAGLHRFIVGVLRWYQRVQGYALLLVDEYPPFSLD